MTVCFLFLMPSRVDFPGYWVIGPWRFWVYLIIFRRKKSEGIDVCLKKYKFLMSHVPTQVRYVVKVELYKKTIYRGP